MQGQHDQQKLSWREKKGGEKCKIEAFLWYKAETYPLSSVVVGRPTEQVRGKSSTEDQEGVELAQEGIGSVEAAHTVCYSPPQP